MISRIFSFFPDEEIATAFLKDIRTLSNYFECEKLYDPKLRDELIQECIEYLQSQKVKRDKK